jgi:inner membrane protein
MPSTVVHLALAGLLAAALLGNHFSRRAVAVVLLVTILPDLDVFTSLVVPGTHRAAFHTLLIPLAAAGLLWYDTNRADESRLRTRFGPAAPQVAWLAIAAYAVAGIGLDMFTGGANVFYPIHDQFYRVNGKLILSTQRGLVQTFVEVGARGVDAGGVGSTETVHVSSGVDPTRGKEPANVDRVFPVVRAGWHLLLVVTSVSVLAARFQQHRD